MKPYCLDLSDLAGNELAEDPTGQTLCSVCQHIGFASITQESCQVAYRGQHIHIGNINEIRKKQACPGCRLVLSAIAHSGAQHTIGDIAPITVERSYFLTWDRSASNHSPAAVQLPHMESFLNVVLGYHEASSRRVAGTIVRREPDHGATQISHEPLFSAEEYFCPHGRQLGDQANISLVKEWIGFCDSQHHGCNQESDRTKGYQPIRLIDGHSNRIVNRSLDTDYIALSYVWGPETEPILTRKTTDTYCQGLGLELSILPSTIADALELTRQLNKRYLWVDSACIIQDDEDDKNQQLPLMPQIYGAAYLVIIAAAGSDAFAGLPGFSPLRPRHTLQQHETIADVQFTTAGPPLQHILSKTTWQTRGWTFQESMLSRRALVFTEHQIYWSCLSEAWREDMHLESTHHGVECDGENTLRTYRIYQPPQGRGNRRLCDSGLYRQIARDFSARSFKEEGDVLWAFTGILEHLSDRFPAGYIWGVPYQELNELLLWSEHTYCPNFHHRKSRHTMAGKSTLPFPSWSWISTNKAVFFVDTCNDPIISELTWQKPALLVEDQSKEHSDGSPATQTSTKASADTRLPSTPGSQITNYGFLRFKAMTVRLMIRRYGDLGASPAANDSSRSLVKPDESQSRRSRVVSSFLRIIRRVQVICKVLFCFHGTRSATIPAKDDGDIPDDTTEDRRAINHGVQCVILGHGDHEIGKIKVPVSYLAGETERLDTFILLSSNVEKEEDAGKRHSDDNSANARPLCAVKRNPIIKKSRNVMLVDFKNDIAFRVAWTKIEEAQWRGVVTEERHIVLG